MADLASGNSIRKRRNSRSCSASTCRVTHAARITSPTRQPKAFRRFVNLLATRSFSYKTTSGASKLESGGVSLPGSYAGSDAKSDGGYRALLPIPRLTFKAFARKPCALETAPVFVSLLTLRLARAFLPLVLMQKLKCTAKRVHCVKTKKIDKSIAANTASLMINNQSSAVQSLSSAQPVYQVPVAPSYRRGNNFGVQI